MNAFPRRDFLRLTAAGLAVASPWAHAQSGWPTKPVTLIVPFPAGGGTDAFARPMSAQFARLTGKQLVIDNRGGAGGTLGAGVAARAQADGYTLFMGAVHHTIAPSMYPKLDYDIEKDLIPLILVASVPQVLVVNPKNISRLSWSWCARVPASSTTGRPEPELPTIWLVSCSNSKARPLSPTSPTPGRVRHCATWSVGRST